jgi:glycosyltransferase involved in cell wall biosynthesis
MKVAIPMSSAFPSEGGGYTFESEIIAALLEVDSELNHNIYIFSASDSGIPERQKYKNLTIIHPLSQLMTGFASSVIREGMTLAQKSKQPKLLSQATKLQAAYVRNYIKKNNFDFSWILAPAALIQCPKQHIPYALTIWDLQHRLQPYFPEVSHNGEWKKRERFYASHLSRATYVITGTERGKFELERFYQLAPERIKILPFPTPNLAKALAGNLFSKDAFLEKYALPDPYFFYPAQFWPHKNHYTLLKALKMLVSQHHIDVSLVLTGSDKGNASYVQQLVQDLDLSTRVHILGFVSRTDLACLYQYALGLVFPTHFGPDNLPPLEAFALGCPVIASQVPGATEQLGDAALLVDQRDANQMALAMKAVYENTTLRQDLIHKGWQRAKRWTPQKYVKALIATLDEFEQIRYCWPNSTSYTDTP